MAEFISEYGAILLEGTWQSILMTVLSTLFAYVIGLPLGVWFHVTTPNGLHPNRVVNTILGWIINIGRSIPFIILMVAMFPLTRLIVGTTLGVPGAIPPLVICATPFVARMVEQSLAEVDAGLIEAAHSFGASSMQIIIKVMLKESLPSIIRGACITFVNLFGYVAMAGAVGAGGLGDVAIRYGFKRWNTPVMVVAVVLCVVIVIVFQTLGDYLARKLDHRKTA